MHPIELAPNIYSIVVNDRSTGLFEGLWPVQEVGVSYNSYLIKDEKNVLIDLSKEIFSDDFTDVVSSIIDLQDLDYIIVQHMEPDHTGILNEIRKRAPKAKVLGMQKAISMMNDFYSQTENTQVLKDGDELSLGKYTLKFFYTPGLHWPETMMSYLVEKQILFSCDAFGMFGALNGVIADDECTNLDFYEAQALRYYSNIVAAFSKNVLMALNKLKDLPVRVIAPSHGLIWRKDPAHILNLYKKWAEYSKGVSDPGITVLYGSMYRNTERALDSVLQVLGECKATVEVFNVSVTDPSFYLPSLLKHRGILVACPTYERAMFPSMVRALDMAEIKGITNKTAAYFGSYAWSGGAMEVFNGYAERLSWDVVGAHQFAGAAKDIDILRIHEICRELAQKSMQL